MTDMTEAVARAIASVEYAGANVCLDAQLADEEIRAMAQAALAAARPIIMADQWQDIETAPRGERILVALEVRNNKTGQTWWEMHAIYFDDETGEICSDNDAGWAAGDYTHWQPLPAPPRTAGAKP